jgi:hypothetical protein
MFLKGISLFTLDAHVIKPVKKQLIRHVLQHPLTIFQNLTRNNPIITIEYLHS